MAQSYFASGYFHANYWNANYFTEFVPATSDGAYWHANYWATGYWHDNYWQLASNTQLILQGSTPNISFTEPRSSVVIDYFAFPGTPNISFATFQSAVANDVTVSVTTPNLILAGINTTADMGTSYEGNVSFTVFVSSTFGFTDTVNAGVESLTLTAINPGIKVGDEVLVGVTSTPALSFTVYKAAAANTVRIDTTMPSLSLTKYSVATGFGTVVEAKVASLSMGSAQTNVLGVNANFQQFAATLAGLTLTSYGTDVDAVELETVHNSGGWGAQNWYNAHRQKSQQRKKKNREIKEFIKTLPPIEAEIAEILHNDIEIEERQAEVNELAREVASSYNEASITRAKQYNPKVAKAYVRAATQGNYSAVEAFEREMDLALEEEEFMFMSLILLD